MKSNSIFYIPLVCLFVLCMLFSLPLDKSLSAAPLSEYDLHIPVIRVVQTPRPDVTPIPVEELLIPDGSFEMGCHSSICWSNQRPVHEVEVDEFYIDKFPVTNVRYAACIEAGHCTHESLPLPHADNPELANHPVVSVDWFQAVAFCTWEGKRLLTEAEWEKAARGTGNIRFYPWGNDSPTCSHANYFNCVGGTSPVDSYPAGASPYGVMDMVGNTKEWVSDWYDDDYYSVSPSYNPQGLETGTARAIRGGAAWNNPETTLRAYYRSRYTPDSASDDLGIRCGRSPQ